MSITDKGILKIAEKVAKGSDKSFEQLFPKEDRETYLEFAKSINSRREKERDNILRDIYTRISRVVREDWTSLSPQSKKDLTKPCKWVEQNNLHK